MANGSAWYLMKRPLVGVLLGLAVGVAVVYAQVEAAKGPVFSEVVLRAQLSIERLRRTYYADRAMYVSAQAQLAVLSDKISKEAVEVNSKIDRLKEACVGTDEKKPSGTFDLESLECTVIANGPVDSPDIGKKKGE